MNSNSSSSFIRTISNYYPGTNGLAEKEVLEEAKRGKDDRQIRGQMCEAYFYLGEERMWKGNRRGAKEYFQKSVDTNVYNFIEYQDSKVILEKMKEN